MDILLAWLHAPWPWYVAGPLIGSLVPLTLWIGNRSFGISSNLRHLCAIAQPESIRVDFFRYNWREHRWGLVFSAGVVLGGFLAGIVFANPQPVALSVAALTMFSHWNVPIDGGFLPPILFDFNWISVFVMFSGGVLVGFGTRYASGCTSGHAITGLSTLQRQSVLAVVGIFTGGLLSAHFVTPHLFTLLD
ncbi:MAG: YeeE/YedE family protein [Hydrogenophilales bacterium 12-61-10]|nr:MAG: YeeE/YedE family protein [Hydrogenophilales bacterium 12-61-10]OYX31124.1 MAG: YeeE/YedE family protein [Hydrogenophilales bacterium 32-62-9]